MTYSKTTDEGGAVVDCNPYSLITVVETVEVLKRKLHDAEISPTGRSTSYISTVQSIERLWRTNKKTGEVAGTEEHHLVNDECNRPNTTLEGLLGLNPYFDKESGNGSVTPGNASQMSDGASVNLLMSREKAEALGLKPIIAFRGFAIAGCEPDEMGIGPVYAVPKLLKRHGLTVDDIGLWELNEAFAVQVIYCRDQLGIPMDRLNVNGSSISIGHPFGMTGSRLVGTIGNEMQRRGTRYGVVTMCIGGGQGAAGLFELCN